MIRPAKNFSFKRFRSTCAAFIQLKVILQGNFGVNLASMAQTYMLPAPANCSAKVPHANYRPVFKPFQTDALRPVWCSNFELFG